MSDNIALPSQHGKIMQSMQHIVRSMKLRSCPDDDIAVREDFGDEMTGEASLGITIHESGEDVDDGVIGFHDVGYRVLFSIVTSKRGDARLTDDLAIGWREDIRRRFACCRLPVAEYDGVRHHNCKARNVSPPNLKKFPNYNIRQILAVVWYRELGTARRSG